jgi:hypothetical protein
MVTTRFRFDPYDGEPEAGRPSDVWRFLGVPSFGFLPLIHSTHFFDSIDHTGRSQRRWSVIFANFPACAMLVMMRCANLDRHHDDMAVPNAPLSDDMVGKCFHVGTASA